MVDLNKSEDVEPGSFREMYLRATFAHWKDQRLAQEERERRERPMRILRNTLCIIGYALIAAAILLFLTAFVAMASVSAATPGHPFVRGWWDLATIYSLVLGAIGVVPAAVGMLWKLAADDF